MRLFERFRAGLQRYADGVHALGGPANKTAIAKFPSELRDFLASFDGARLFHESYVLLCAEEIARRPDGWLIGHGPEGEFVLGEDGAVRVDDEYGDGVVIGGSIDSMLAAIVARESILMDREGEFLDVFERDGVELVPAVQKKRSRATEKADPKSAFWHYEQGERAIEDGDAERAIAALERAVEADPGAGSAWALLGALRRQTGDAKGAYQAFSQAVSQDEEVHARRLMEAARAAQEAKLERERAAAVSQIDDALATRICDDMMTRAETCYRDGDKEGASNLAGCVDAVRPSARSGELLRLNRARAALRSL